LHEVVTWDPGTPAFQPTALIITSTHALAGAAAVGTHLPLFVVGQSTAQLAREVGFTTCYVAHDIEALEKVITEKTIPRQDHLHYLRGEKITKDLKGSLALKGYTVTEQCVYRTLYTQPIPPALTAILQSSAVHYVLFFSMHSAEHFCNLIQEASLDNEVKKLIAIAISPKVAKSCAQLTWRDIIAADHPSLEGVLTTLAIEGSPC
jgi:uroporphyrinogen-III synthase